ncbi:hypothetical protein ABZ619_43455 [Streptomyces sp. NPDC007851]|uniref:hypothetical protein n=1 Tax=Streptomyces sp. NPDC007851 TaxID=3155008 RepID=UPI0034095AE8
MAAGLAEEDLEGFACIPATLGSRASDAVSATAAMVPVYTAAATPAGSRAPLRSWGRGDMGRHLPRWARVAGRVVLPMATRAKNQGMADVSIATVGATGGFSSGLVVCASGCPSSPSPAASSLSPSSPRSPPARAAGDPAGPVGGSGPPSPSTAPGTVVHVFARTSSARC